MTRNHKLFILSAIPFIPWCVLSRASAQNVSFDSLISTPVGGIVSSYLVTADFDADGDIDVAVSRFVSGVGHEVVLFPNLGAGEFGAPVQLASGVNGALAAADFDGDGDVDLATNMSGSIRVHVNNGATPFLSLPPITSALGSFSGLEAADLDSDGDVDMFAMGTGFWSSSGQFIENLGGMSFQANSFNAVESVGTSFGIGDLDGDGDADLALCDANGADVDLFRKIAGPSSYQYWSSLSGGTDPDHVALGDLDADLDLDVVATNTLGLSLTVWRNLGTSTFAAPISIALTVQPTALLTADMDRAGGSEIVVGFAGGFRIYSESSPGVFTLVGSTGQPVLGDLRASDLDNDSDLDIFSAAGSSNSFGAARNTRLAGRVVCAGDGSATACPCSNPSPPQSGTGCATSSTAGGSLRAEGGAALSNDGLILSASLMPAGTFALFIQGGAAVSGGNGSTFGDGLLCTGGSIIRLAVKAAAPGSVDFPGAGDPSVSSAGSVVAPMEQVYQVWFRDAANFCTPSTFNWTNGLILAWRP